MRNDRYCTEGGFFTADYNPSVTQIVTSNVFHFQVLFGFWTRTGLTGHWRLFALVSSEAYIFVFGHVCKTKLSKRQLSCPRPSPLCVFISIRDTAMRFCDVKDSPNRQIAKLA